MKIKTFTFFICMLFSLIFSVILAQNNDSTTYFYTKKVTETKISDISDLIKTDIYSIAEGDLPIIWEHRFSDNFTLEGGLGMIMPFTNDIMSTIIPIAQLNPDFKNKKFGLSFVVEPRYRGIENTKVNYFSAIARLRSYDQLFISEYGLGFGTSFNISKITVEPAVYFTFCFQKTYGGNTIFKYNPSTTVESLGIKDDYNNQTAVRMTFALKLGYPIK